MRAIEAKTFSGYDALRQAEYPKPQPAKDRVLVRVTAAGVTPIAASPKLLECMLAEQCLILVKP
jgi:hypothetical protein